MDAYSKAQTTITIVDELRILVFFCQIKPSKININ